MSMLYLPKVNTTEPLLYKIIHKERAKMDRKPRQKEILEILKEKNYVTVDYLSYPMNNPPVFQLLSSMR
jgi:hypothetical protein